MDPELTQELEEQIRQLNQTLAQLNGVMSDQSKAVSTTTTSVQQNNNTVKNNKQVKQQNSQAQDKLAEASKSASEAMNKASQNFSSALGHGAQALGSFQAALFSSQEGMSKYGKAAESAGAAAADIGKNFGLLGGAVGGLLAVFGKIVGEIFKLNDNIINMRDSFTKTAGILPTTTAELGNLAKQARFSLDDMQKLSKATNSLGQNLLGLGGYAGQGAIKFMKMANVSDDVRRQYGRLGVSQEQLLDLQSKYVQMQGVSGQAMHNQTKSSEQLRKESLAYADNLIKMSSLTGKAAEELQAERDAAMLEYEEQLQIAAENKKIADLRAAGRDEEADAIQTEQSNRAKLIQTYTDLYGKEQGQLAGRLMRQGGYDEKTAGLSIRDPNMLAFTQDLKKSKDAMSDIAKQADKTDKSIGEASVRYGKALQYAGEETGKNVGLTSDLITSANKRSGQSVSESLDKIGKEIDKKKQAGTDPLADNIEGVRSFEREMKARLQTMLEYIDPMRMGFDKLKKIAIAAAVALGAVAAIMIAPKVLRGAAAVVSGVKAVGSGISKGFGAFTGLFKRGASTASGPKSLTGAITGAISGSGSNSSGASTLTKVTKVAGTPGVSKSEKFLLAIVRGLQFLDKMGKSLVQGSVYAGGAIVAIGGVIAALEYVMQDQLPFTANKLKQFEKIDGPKIEAIGLAMGGLGAGVLAAGGGKIADSISNVIDWFTGDEDPFTDYAKHMVKFQQPKLNAEKVENNADAIISFAKAMAILTGKSTIGSLGSASKSLADGISSYFKGTPPVQAVQEFSQLKINAKQTKNNANAFVAFSEAIGTYKGMGKPTSVISSALATAALRYFNSKPPVEQFSEFSRLNIDGKKTTKDAKAFVDFATAMSRYKGGPGLVDTVSSWLSSTIFGEDGPIERYRKFAKEDFGSTPSATTTNFQAYAEKIQAESASNPSLGSPPSQTFGDAVESGANRGAQLGAGVVGALTGGAAATGQAVTKAAGWVGEKLGLTSGKSLDYGKLKSKNAFIVHHTAGRGTAAQVMQVFKQRGVGTQYIVDREGRIHQALLPGGRGVHIKNGTGAGKGLNNSNTEGVEVIAKDDDDVLPVQIAATKKLISQLGYGPKQVFGHGEVNAHKMRTEGNKITRAYTGIPLRSPQAIKGGTFSGPNTGYPIEMHGTEMVVPLELNSILVKIAQTPVKNNTTITKETTTTKSNTGQSTKTGGKVDAKSNPNLELYSLVTKKLEDMISVLESSNDTHDQRLKYVKV